MTITPPLDAASQALGGSVAAADLPMPDQEFTFPVLYLRHIADQIRGLGGDVERWLAGSQLCEAQLLEPGLTIGFPVLSKLVLDAQQVTSEPALGLFVGRRLSALAHGMLGYGAMNSSTMRQAVELFERFVGVRISLLAISHQVHDDVVQVRFEPTAPLGATLRPLLEGAVLSVKNVFDAISLGTGHVRMIAFPFKEPEYAELARELFGCEVRYGQPWTGFAFPAAQLDVPLKLADPQAFETAAQICQRELDKLCEKTSMATRVRRLLLEKQAGFPSLQVAARMFHLTPRTLHRRLDAEGTSFRAILEDVRHTLAVEHMKSGSLSIEELAYSLGYSDLANFRRAFKRWEGVPPSAYRAPGPAAPKDVPSTAPRPSAGPSRRKRG